MAIVHQSLAVDGIGDMRGERCVASGASSRLAELSPVSPSHPIRWIPHRKAEVVAEVSAGKLTLEQACARHAISIEEYDSWQRNIALFGITGLQVSGVQRRRRLRTPPAPPRSQ